MRVRGTHIMDMGRGGFWCIFTGTAVAETSVRASYYAEDEITCVSPSAPAAADVALEVLHHTAMIVTSPSAGPPLRYRNHFTNLRYTLHIYHIVCNLRYTLHAAPSLTLRCIRQVTRIP